MKELQVARLFLLGILGYFGLGTLTWNHQPLAGWTAPMRKTRLISSLLLVCSWPLWPAGASAGPYADDMAKCLVRETGAADRTALTNWIFAAMALHPDVETMATIGDELRGEINQVAGALFQRLLVESCRDETKLAIKYEGPSAIQSAFGLLGQIAMQDLFANPKVAAGLGELEKNMDREKISELSRQ